MVGGASTGVTFTGGGEETGAGLPNFRISVTTSPKNTSPSQGAAIPGQVALSVYC